MIKGLGTDLVYLPRVKEIVAKGDRFAKRVLTQREFELYQKRSGKGRVQFLAGRFGVKEAFSKAMGTGIGKYLSWQDVETLPDPLGKPVTTSPKFAGRVSTSISDDHDYTVVVVILEEE